MRLFKYLYYTLFMWNIKKIGTNNMPKYNAILGMSFFQFLNIVTIFELIQFIRGYKLQQLNTNDKILIFLFGTILLGTNYFLFVKAKKHNEIITKFESEPEQEKRKGRIIIWLYIFLSFAIPIIIALLPRNYLN